MVEVSPRMQQLLDAAVRVTASQGLRGLTHRAVDREAGLPEGSCSAYLRTRQALLTALTEYVAGRFASEVADLGSRLAARAENATLAHATGEAARMFRSWLREPALLQTRLELTLEAQRQPVLADILAAWTAQLVEIVAAMMQRQCHDHPEARAETLTAAMDGVLVRAMRQPASERSAYLERNLDLLFPALVTAPYPEP